VIAVAEPKVRAIGHLASREELDAERALIGAVVLGASLVEIRPMLKVDDFAQAVLGSAYGAALKLEAAGIAVDGVTLASALEALPAPAGEGTMLDRINGRAGLGILSKDCPTTRNAGHYARLIAEAAAARAGRVVIKPSPAVIVERVGLGYRAAFPAGVDLKVDRLHESRGELSGELAVRWTRPTLATQDGHIYRGRFNLSGLTARGSAARFLNDRTRGAEIPWAELLERFCIGVLDAHRAGEAFQTVGQREPRPAPGRLLDPILPADAATLLYGPGGSGKSTLAAAIALSVQTGREIVPGWKPLSSPVLVLDWEASADEWNDRLAALSAGNCIDPPAIHYRRMEGSLAERVEELASFVTEYLIGLIIVDSVGMASGSSRDGSDANESALRLFAALRAIGATSLLVDHVAGAELDKSAAIGKAYGSVYKMNLARAAYELRRESEGSQERTELVLRQAKINDQGKLPAIALAVVYEPGRIRFETTRATAPELIPMASTGADRIASLLATGSMFAPAIADHLGLTQETVRALLSRYRTKRFIKLQDGSWGLVRHE
jgi:hypothetical protein